MTPLKARNSTAPARLSHREDAESLMTPGRPLNPSAPVRERVRANCSAGALGWQALHGGEQGDRLGRQLWTRAPSRLIGWC